MSCFRPDSASSILATRSNDVSVRTNRTARYENQSVKWLIFSFAKNHPNSIRKDQLSKVKSFLKKTSKKRK